MSRSEYWTELARRRLSRRRLLGAGTVAGAGLWMGSMLGCGGSMPVRVVETRRSQSTSAPQKGGILRWSNAVAEPAGVDPYVTRHYAGPVYEKLVRYTPKKDKIEPWLAESWEVPDDTTYIFRLKKGVKFHNVAPVSGREMTAEDAKFSMERALTEGAQYPLRPSFTSIDKSEAAERYLFKITTKAPFAPLLSNMALFGDYIMPKEIIGSDNVAATAVGTGPFMFDRWDRGEKMAWKRNPDYHVAGQPYLNGIEMRWVADYTTAVAIFVSDQTDIVVIYATDSKIVAQKRPKAKLAKGSSLMHYTLRFRSGFKPLDDIRVRQAMDLTYSRPNVVFRVGGGIPDTRDYGFKTGPISADLENWALPMSELERRPGYMEVYPKTDAVAQAKKLMAEAGYADGFDVVILNTPEQYRDMAVQLAQEQWREIGIRATIRQMEQSAFVATGIKGDFQILQWYTGSSDPDPDGQLYSQLRTGSVSNWGRWSDPTLDKMLDEQRATLDPLRRKAIVYDIQRRILDTVPSIWIFDYVTFAFASERVQNHEVFEAGSFAGSFPMWDQIGRAWLTK